HMFATGQVLLPFFSVMSMLIAVPTGVKFFNWVGTMWRGKLTFQSPMLWSIGFLVTFLFGGLSGVILASPPLDFHVTGTYFVVAEVDREVARRPAGLAPFLDAVLRFPRHVPDPALAGCDGHAAPGGGLPAGAGLRLDEPGVLGVGDAAGRLHAALPVERVQDLAARAEGHRGRPVGLRQLSGVGHLLPTAAAQLRHPAPGALGATCLRPAPPRGVRPGPRRAGRRDGRC